MSTGAETFFETLTLVYRTTVVYFLSLNAIQLGFLLVGFGLVSEQVAQLRDEIEAFRKRAG